MNIRSVLLVSVFIFVTRILFAQDSVTYPPNTYPKGYTAHLNVVYSKVYNYECKMDQYIAPTTGKSSPVVINIHGGGWVSGTKESQYGFGLFYKLGYSVINIEYRMLATAPAPAAI